MFQFLRCWYPIEKPVEVRYMYVGEKDGLSVFKLKKTKMYGIIYVFKTWANWKILSLNGYLRKHEYNLRLPTPFPFGPTYLP